MNSEARTTITWLGHATVLLEVDGVRLLSDPVLRDRIGPLVRIAPAGGIDPPRRVDGVLLSHLHADHADIPSLRAVARAGPILAPHPAGAWLARKGLHNVQELRPGAHAVIGGVPVVATPARHDPRRRPFGPRAEPIGFLVGATRPVYFAGDTDLFPAMRELRGSVAVALLPVWGWGSRLGPGHLDPERAARAVATIAPEVAIPIHWGSFALRRPGGRLPDPERPAREFARLAHRHAPSVEVRLLRPGDRTEL
jgi:L-ascorbate metabolism protein UlaG (beta-lactamase superfamily)